MEYLFDFYKQFPPQMKRPKDGFFELAVRILVLICFTPITRQIAQYRPNLPVASCEWMGFMDADYGVFSMKGNDDSCFIISLQCTVTTRIRTVAVATSVTSEWAGTNNVRMRAVRIADASLSSNGERPAGWSTTLVSPTNWTIVVLATTTLRSVSHVCNTSTWDMSLFLWSVKTTNEGHPVSPGCSKNNSQARYLSRSGPQAYFTGDSFYPAHQLVRTLTTELHRRWNHRSNIILF